MTAANLCRVAVLLPCISWPLSPHLHRALTRLAYYTQQVFGLLIEYCWKIPLTSMALHEYKSPGPVFTKGLSILSQVSAQKLLRPLY